MFWISGGSTIRLFNLFASPGGASFIMIIIFFVLLALVISGRQGLFNCAVWRLLVRLKGYVLIYQH